MLLRQRVHMETHDIQRVLRARYGGVEASDVLVQFARIEIERPDALAWMQNGKFYEVYGDAARLLGRLLDLRVAEKPLMTGRNRQPLMLSMTGITSGITRLEGERAQRHRALCDELGVMNSYHVGRLSLLPGWWFAAETCQEALQ